MQVTDLPKLATRRNKLKKFDFRSVHPQVRFGTASDRYAGWIGQIYSEDYRDRVATRHRRLAGQTFEEGTVPIDSVAEYFKHFGVLELDFTYYRPLLEGGAPTQNFSLIEDYISHAPSSAKFFLKVPRTFFARRVRRSKRGKPVNEPNPRYLDIDGYMAEFHEPAVELLGDKLEGLIFEQEYQRQQDSPTSAENIETLDAFFSAVPRNTALHIEFRSSHLLDEQYFDWLETTGIGHVFSHWTWLPPIQKQWELSGERLTEKNKQVVARLLTPLQMPYAEAYSRTHPFDQVNNEIAGTSQARNMTMDTVALAYQAIKRGGTLNVLANNRAWGNAPELAKTIAERLLAEEENLAEG